ncbi:MAG: M48 family metalloprotease [Alphaproteobacteria bacterium]|nr:M48 family metalloprotease [Alphaproteobacteria bacterium]
MGVPTLASVLFRLLIIANVVWWGLADAARAQGLALIRDAEIEHIIRSWTDPMLQAAGIDPAAVHIMLVNDGTLNAFVAGGQNLFLNAGLLMASQSPGQVTGVIAHEIGHIAGGHLARSQDALRSAENVSLLHALLGLGIIALGATTGASGAAGVGGAVMAGGQIAGYKTLLTYSRIQERSADHAGLIYLDRTRQSARGLYRFLETLLDQELLVVARQDPYLRSHPLTQDRLNFIDDHMRKSPWTEAPEPQRRLLEHARMKAKLVGFLEWPERVLRAYPLEDQSVPARYARAVAYYRLPDLEQALAELDSLIAEQPNDPYFQELKGQVLFENGRGATAIPYYETANRLEPDNPLLLTELAKVQIESGEPELYRPAVEALERSAQLDPTNGMTWRLLAVGYGRDGDIGKSSLAAGELALLEGRPKDALLHTGRAQRLFAEGSPEWLQAEDIRKIAERHANKE